MKLKNQPFSRDHGDIVIENLKPKGTYYVDYSLGRGDGSVEFVAKFKNDDLVNSLDEHIQSILSQLAQTENVDENARFQCLDAVDIFKDIKECITKKQSQPCDLNEVLMIMGNSSLYILQIRVLDEEEKTSLVESCIYDISEFAKKDFQKYDLKRSKVAQKLDPFDDPIFVLRINDDLLRAYTKTIIKYFFNNTDIDASKLEQIFVNHFYDLFLSKINILEGIESKYNSNHKVFMPPFIKYVIDCIGPRETYCGEYIPEIQIVNPTYVEWSPHTKDDLAYGPPDEECYKKWVYLSNYNQDVINLRYDSNDSSLDFLFNSFIDSREGNDDVMFAVVDDQVVSVTSDTSVLDVLVAALLGVNSRVYVQQKEGRDKVDSFQSYGYTFNFQEYYCMMAAFTVK